ncbi:hypothetical protein NCS56_01502000 [Fusarium sp. Ph1]|nr:hypothetical protein NCS56_01502000 [Fusarium sp. Ph1]
MCGGATFRLEAGSPFEPHTSIDDLSSTILFETYAAMCQTQPKEKNNNNNNDNNNHLSRLSKNSAGVQNCWRWLFPQVYGQEESEEL